MVGCSKSPKFANVTFTLHCHHTHVFEFLCQHFSISGFFYNSYMLAQTDPQSKFSHLSSGIPSEWFHMAIAVSGLYEGQGMSGFINGVWNFTDTDHGVTGFEGGVGTTIEIGKNLNVQLYVDDFAIWLKERTPAQISALFTG